MAFFMYNYTIIHNPFTYFAAAAIKLNCYFFIVAIIITAIFNSYLFCSSSYCWLGFPSARTNLPVYGYIVLIIPYLTNFIVALLITLNVSYYFKNIRDLCRNNENLKEIYTHIAFHSNCFFIFTTIYWFVLTIFFILILILVEVNNVFIYKNTFFYLFTIFYGLCPLLTCLNWKRNVFNNI